MGSNTLKMVYERQTMSVAALFSGQGSQYVGMGADLLGKYPAAQRIADQVRNVIGNSVLDCMLTGPPEELTKTVNTQPALFIHEAMVLAVTGVTNQCSALAGHSLGEFTAMYASGALLFRDALHLVSVRGRLMFEAGSRIPGTMAAVLGLENEQVAEICTRLTAENNGTIVPANYNSPGQVVVSGSEELVRNSLAVFKEHGARMAKELQVSGAFHSPLLESAMEEWTSVVQETTFNDANIPVYVNVSGVPVTSATDLRTSAIRQMVNPVLWTQSLQAMHASGINHFIEVGPQAVLQGLVKRTLQDVTLEGLDTLDQCERYIQTKGEYHGKS